MNIKKFKNNAKCLVALMIILQILLMPLAVFAEGIEGEAGGTEVSGGGNGGDTGGTGDSGGSGGIGTVGETGGSIGSGNALDALGNGDTNYAGNEGVASNGTVETPTPDAPEVAETALVPEANDVDAGEVGVVAEGEGAENAPTGGNSYVAELTDGNVVVGTSQVHQFNLEFTEVGQQTLGSVQFDLGTDFSALSDVDSVTATGGKNWYAVFTAGSLFFTLKAAGESDYLTTNESVSVAFKATTPNAVGVYDLGTTQAWTDNSAVDSGGNKNNPAASHIEPEVWVAGNSLIVDGGGHGILQNAIDAASDYDAIFVKPGEYTETTHYNPANNTNIGINNPVGMLINKPLYILGVDDSSKPKNNVNGLEATIISGVQSNWGTNLLVTADNVRIEGLHFKGTASGVTVNKVFEILKDGFVLKNSHISAVDGKTLSSALYFNDEIVPNDLTGFVSDISSYLLKGNKLDGGLVISHGTGYGCVDPDFLVIDNVFLSGTGIGIQGNIAEIAWLNAPAKAPTLIVGNTFSTNLTRVLRHIESDQSNITINRNYVESLIANNDVGKASWVLDSSGDLKVGNFNNGTFEYDFVQIYTSINSAIGAAGDFNTVQVAPGIYKEAVSINTPNLTLKSTGGRDLTIVENPNVGSDTAGIGVVANMGVVTVDGFTVNNFRNGIVQGMASAAGTAFHVFNNKIIPENINTDPYLRNGIQVSGNDSQVIGNYVVGAPLTSTWASSGIHVVNATNVMVKGNTVNSSAADIGISISNWSAPIVENITIDGNTVIGAGNGIRISGQTADKEVTNVTILNNILKSGNRGINAQTVTLSDVLIKGNEIHNNLQQGVRFSNSAALSGFVLVNDNSIVGNIGYGVINQQTAFVVDATNNWWGHASGPYHATKNPGGQGDEVSDNVLFDPWYVPPVVPGPVVVPGTGFYNGLGMPAFTPLSLNPPGNTGDGEAGGPVAQALDLAPEAPLVNPGQFLVIPPDDPETTPEGMVSVQFILEGSAEELEALLSTYEAMLAEFDANWEDLTDSEYAYALIDLSVAWAALQLTEARLSGNADDLTEAVEAYQLALENIANYGDQIADNHMEVIMEVMAAIAEQLVALGAELES